MRITEKSPRALTLAAFVAIAMALSACNTFRGAGQDIEQAGEEIQEGATDVQQDMSN